MAGVKISKLLDYNEVFTDQEFSDNIGKIVLPVSLGNKTIKLTTQELLNILNNKDVEQDIKISENTELINALTSQILEKLANMETQQAEVDEQQNVDIENVTELGVNPWEVL